MFEGADHQCPLLMKEETKKKLKAIWLDVRDTFMAELEHTIREYGTSRNIAFLIIVLLLALFLIIGNAFS